MAQLPNLRRNSDVTINTRLTDSGVAVSWAGLEDIRVLAYSVEQSAVAGPCTAAVDPNDGDKLVVSYPATVPQYLGVFKTIIRCTYHGREKTYDVAVGNFVASTAEATGAIDIDDPVVDVLLEVTEVSTSLLDEAIAAAFDAAEAAQTAAGEANAAKDSALQAADAANDAAAAANKAKQDANSAAGRANSSANKANSAAESATEAAGAAAETATKSPYIGDNGNWYIYNAVAKK